VQRLQGEQLVSLELLQVPAVLAQLGTGASDG
jgi:hypothetical protein